MFETWMYIKMPDESIIYTNFSQVNVDGKDYWRQVIYSDDPFNRGVYLLTKFQYEWSQDTLHLRLHTFDELLSGSDEEFIKKLQGMNLVSYDEINQLNKTNNLNKLPGVCVSYY